MMKYYLGAVCGREGNYGIVFRDFPGCVSAGDTLDEVLAMGRQALQGHIELMIEDGDPVPEPTEHSLRDVDAWLHEEDDADHEPWTGLYPVEVDVPPYPETVSVPIDTDLVQAVDRLVPNRRQFIMEATRRELDRMKKSA
jgi:predicted RNase H-like HicB family nuclease